LEVSTVVAEVMWRRLAVVAGDAELAALARDGKGTLMTRPKGADAPNLAATSAHPHVPSLDAELAARMLTVRSESGFDFST